MGLSIGATLTSYGVGEPFVLASGGSNSIQWILDPLLTIVAGVDTDLSLTVMFNAEGPATVTLTDQSGDKLPSVSVNLYGISGTCPTCTPGTCENCNKKVTDDSCPCEYGGNSADSTYESSNSIKIDQNFDVSLVSSCMAIQTLGSDLSL